MNLPTNVAKLLSEREGQVASMLCGGLTNAEIAVVLEISVKTVDTHRMHVMQKLEIQGNVQLLRVVMGMPSKEA